MATKYEYICKYCNHIWNMRFNPYGELYANQQECCPKCLSASPELRKYDTIDTYAPAPEEEKIDYYAPRKERR
jgi:hypothetical protein